MVDIKRCNNYDLLRIICCIAVIVIHVTAIYKNILTEKSEMTIQHAKYALDVIIWDVLPRFAVPCFVMISGAFNLSNNKNKNYKEFYKKTLKRIGLPTIFISILFTIIEVTKSIIKHGSYMEILYSIKLLIMGNAAEYLWFLYMILELYLLVPIIIQFKDSISKKSFRVVSWTFLVLACASGYTSTHELSWDIGRSFLYLGYFMVGYEIKQKYENNQNSMKAIFFITLGLLLEALIIPIQYNHTMLGISEKMEKYTLVGNFNPIILLTSVLLFSGFSNIKLKKNLSKLSNLTFFIYIFHAFALKALNKFFKIIEIDKRNINVNIVILTETIGVFIISCFCSMLWIKIWNLRKDKYENWSYNNNR